MLCYRSESGYILRDFTWENLESQFHGCSLTWQKGCCGPSISTSWYPINLLLFSCHFLQLCCLSSSCCSKMTKTGQLKQQPLISHSSRGLGSWWWGVEGFSACLVRATVTSQKASSHCVHRWWNGLGSSKGPLLQGHQSYWWGLCPQDPIIS
jgi:hypothetical protein